MKTKIILTQTLAIIILAYFLFQKPDIQTEIKTVEKIVKVVDTFYVSKPSRIREVIVEIEKDTPIKTKEFIYKDTIKTAFLTSTITADNIYSRKIDIVLHEKHIETEIKRSVFKPRFYIGNGITFSDNRSVENITLEASLATKRFLIGGGVGVDTKKKGVIFPIRIAFKF